MDLDAIRRYRAAVFSGRLTAQLSEARSLGSTPDWLAATNLVRAALDLGDGPSWSYDDLSGNPELSDIAARITLLVSEVQLMWFGVNEGYYPAELGQRNLAFLKQNAEPAFVKLVTAVDDRGHENADDSFTTLQVFWAEAATPELRECVRLVAFAFDGVWRDKIGKVERLAERLRENPSLHLSAGEVDDLSWSLTGAEDLLSGGVYLPDPLWVGSRKTMGRGRPGLGGLVNVDLFWSAAFRAFYSSDWRVEQLTNARDSIRAVQEFMSDDPSIVTARWLRASGREVSPSSGDAASAIRDPEFRFGGDSPSAEA